MPHITFPLADLQALSGEPDLTIPRVGELAMLVKGELKERHSTPEEVKVELQDTNRPDTWCVEGIARQVRQHRTGEVGEYGFFDSEAVEGGAIEVDGSVEHVRPFVAGFVAKGYTVDDAGLKAFISAQEVLCRNYGRMRKSVAIGIYDASSMTFPVRYEAVDAASDARAFQPLPPAGEGHDPARFARVMTPAEILTEHPTGKEYAAALKVPGKAPILVDAKGEVLSFPPIINSATLGRVAEGMSELFVEVTGDTLDQVILATNILAANLADRGATIHACLTRYPFDTPRGREVRAPHPLHDRRQVEVAASEFGALLGEPELTTAEIVDRLRHFGLTVTEQGEALAVTTLPYRADYLHAVDAIEDFAISRGYDSFQAKMPEEFTVGGLSALTRFADLLRDRAIGVGFEETIGNLLTSVERVRERMELDEVTEWAPLHGGKLVRIKNVMNLNYSVLRDWLLPTLLEVESSSTSAEYPHRFFEAGEVCVWDASANLSTRTELRLGAVVADHEVGFSETQAFLNALLHTLGLAFGEGYTLEEVAHPCFIPGRATWIKLGDEVIGILGEVHPAVLTQWGIRFPVGAFELRIDPLMEALTSP